MNDRSQDIPPAPAADADRDAPLREDIRLLGRVLGDTLREQHGAAIFDLIENVRQTAIRFRRDREPVAKRELEAMTLPPLSTIRGISRRGRRYRCNANLLST